MDEICRAPMRVTGAATWACVPTGASSSDGRADDGNPVRQALNDAATSEVCADWGYRYFAECPNRQP